MPENQISTHNSHHYENIAFSRSFSLVSPSVYYPNHRFTYKYMAKDFKTYL